MHIENRHDSVLREKKNRNKPNNLNGKHWQNKTKEIKKRYNKEIRCYDDIYDTNYHKYGNSKTDYWDD